MSDIHATTWFHGTHSPQFAAWKVPPPPVSGEELRVPHTGIFFTKDLTAAQGAGPNVCSVRVTDKAKILDATASSTSLEQLRKLVLQNQLASYCNYAQAPQAWSEAWRTGEVLRYASDDPRFLKCLAQYASGFKGGTLEQRSKIALHNLTRGWIEHIVCSAAHLGFNALHGFEIDRHSGGAPRAVSWLAVTDAKAVTAPSWQ